VCFAQIVGSLRSFVLAKVVDPSDYGIWTGSQTIISLSPIVCLGTMEALLKMVPYYRGKQDSEGLRQVESNVLGTLAIAATLLSVVLLLLAPALPFAFIRQNIVVVRISAASAAIGLFSAFYYHRCASYEDFKSVSFIDGLRSTLGCFCVLLFAWRWGVVGAVLGFLVGEVFTWIVSAAICARAHGNVQVRFQPVQMGRAVRVGFPITIIWWVYVIHTNIGRMTSLSYLGNAATGFYGVGSSMAMLFSLVPNTIGRVFYPRVNAQIGAKAGLRDLRETVVKPATAITMVLPVAQVIIFYLLPVVYNDFLPKYKTGLGCAQILIMGAFFVGLIRSGANYLIAVDMQGRLMKYICVSLVANAGISVLLVKSGMGINGLAIATSVASALLASMIWKKVFAELEYEAGTLFGLLFKFYLPFLAALAAIALVQVGFSRYPNYSRLIVIVEMLIALSLFALICFSFPSARHEALTLYRRGLSHLVERIARLRGANLEMAPNSLGVAAKPHGAIPVNEAKS
jgi:O-antigen/teichoic acid export membrane protein